MKIRVFSTFFLLFFFLLQGTGGAFVPNTPHLLDLVIKKIKQPVGIEAYQNKKIINNKDTELRFVQLEEKLWFLFPDKVRSEIVSKTNTSFSVESRNGFAKVMNGVMISSDKSSVDHYTDILLYRNPRNLSKKLIMAGIDTSVVSFQRYDDTICYVIGAPLEKGRPYAGLWIEKDTYLPRKYVIKKKGWVVEFFYNKWQKVSKIFYPMQISIFLDNKLYAMIDVKSFDLKSGFSSEFFNIEHIKKLFPKNDTNALDENARQVEELDEQIENFIKLYK